MAKPIKDTPILKGKDARKFIQNEKNSATKVISTAEKEKMKANYLLIKSLAHS